MTRKSQARKQREKAHSAQTEVTVQVQINRQTARAEVVLHVPNPWVGFTPDQAEQLAAGLKQRAQEAREALFEKGAG